jgi:pyridinium-3,5-biscarboxylic acid mononucleotide sulfurtransferase
MAPPARPASGISALQGSGSHRYFQHMEAPAPWTAALAEKERLLQQWLADAGSVLIGFSGGVDSTLLACVAVETLGAERVLAMIGRSPSYPDSQWASARDVAARFSIPVEEVGTEEMNDPSYAANPENRCYFCKRELWSRLVPVAAARGLARVIDGTNADDLGDYRPGAKAAQERGVASPLAEAGLTKAEIRELSRRRGISTWSAPSSPCLSSRIPYHTPVTRDRLDRIERAESGLRAIGVAGDLRVRYHGTIARVELDAEALADWSPTGRREQLREVVLAAGFNSVVLDLRGFRSGSLNVLSGVTAAGQGA